MSEEADLPDELEVSEELLSEELLSDDVAAAVSELPEPEPSAELLAASRLSLR